MSHQCRRFGRKCRKSESNPHEREVANPRIEPVRCCPAVTLAMICCQGADRGAGAPGARVGEIARGGRPGGSDVASPQPAARHGELPKYSRSEEHTSELQ